MINVNDDENIEIEVKKDEIPAISHDNSEAINVIDELPYVAEVEVVESSENIEIQTEESDIYVNITKGSAGHATWGSITGTLTEQTDLNTALNKKANVADLGRLAGKNNADYETDVTNKPVLGALADHNTVDYETEISNLPENFPPSPHTHDDRYYTESEMDFILDGKSDKGHTHDERYYTESEVRTLLSYKSDVGHIHDDRYYTGWEIDALLSIKSDVGHKHDDRYYTKSDVDTLLTLKASISDLGTMSTVDDAPSDGIEYVRKNGAWSAASTGGTSAWGNITGTLTDQTDLASALADKANTADLGDLATKNDVDYETEVTNKPSTFPPSSHTHDDRYYTESEVDTLLSAKANTVDLGDLANKDKVDWDTDIDDIPQTFPPSSHNHDDRYYTESEMDTALALKANNADLGDLAVKNKVDWDTDIDNIPSTFSPSAHTHDDRYYTESEVDTALALKANTADLGALATKDKVDWDTDIDDIPSTFPPSAHNHDDRYYTESETNSLLSAKADNTDLANYLPLTGGTMSGNLNLNNVRIYAKSTGIDEDSAPSSTKNYAPYEWYDKDGNLIAHVELSQTTNNELRLNFGVRRYINSEWAWKNFYYQVAADGTLSYGFGSPSAVRNAIGASSGIFPASVGGTGVSKANANRVFAGPSSGSAAAPTFRELAVADIPSLSDLGAVAKSGDTMSDSLTIETTSDKGFYVKNTDITLGSAPSAARWLGGFAIRDKDGKNTGYYETYIDASGNIYAAMVARNRVNNANSDNYLRLYSNVDGTRTVALSHSSAWRKALGIGQSDGSLPLTIGQGGTGATTAADARVNLGANSSGLWTIARGGTGASTAADARTNLGFSLTRDNKSPAAQTVSHNNNTNVCEFTLSAGLYVIICSATFANNSSGGRRYLFLADSSNSSLGGTFQVQTPPTNGGSTMINCTGILSISASTTYHLMAYQNSGGDLSVTPRVVWLKIL